MLLGADIRLSPHGCLDGYLASKRIVPEPSEKEMKRNHFRQFLRRGIFRSKKKMKNFVGEVFFLAIAGLMGVMSLSHFRFMSNF